MDTSFCREQAKLVRSLADQADPFIKRRLLQLAEHYERRLGISKAPNERPDEGATKNGGMNLSAMLQPSTRRPSKSAFAAHDGWIVTATGLSIEIRKTTVD